MKDFLSASEKCLMDSYINSEIIMKLWHFNEPILLKKFHLFFIKVGDMHLL